jgi:hypothetical protein
VSRCSRHGAFPKPCTILSSTLVKVLRSQIFILSTSTASSGNAPLLETHENWGTPGFGLVQSYTRPEKSASRRPIERSHP